MSVWQVSEVVQMSAWQVSSGVLCSECPSGRSVRVFRMSVWQVSEVVQMSVWQVSSEGVQNVRLAGQ